MTQFTKENLVIGSEFVQYRDAEGKIHFVARCKYGRGKGSFITFLKKNFTVEEYFDRLNAGEYPLPILESKGYVLPHIKKWLKEAGLPETREGYEIFVARNVAKRVGI